MCVLLETDPKKRVGTSGSIGLGLPGWSRPPGGPRERDLPSLKPNSQNELATVHFLSYVNIRP